MPDAIKNDHKTAFQNYIKEFQDLAAKMKTATKDNADDLLAAAPIVQDNMKKSKAHWKKVCSAFIEAGR